MALHTGTHVIDVGPNATSNPYDQGCRNENSEQDESRRDQLIDGMDRLLATQQVLQSQERRARRFG